MPRIPQQVTTKRNVTYIRIVVKFNIAQDVCLRAVWLYMLITLCILMHTLRTTELNKVPTYFKSFKCLLFIKYLLISSCKSLSTINRIHIIRMEYQVFCSCFILILLKSLLVVCSSLNCHRRYLIMHHIIHVIEPHAILSFIDPK